MHLLLNTDMEKQIKEKIRGHVARVGGAIEQELPYGMFKITDINILDGGFGQVRKLSLSGWGKFYKGIKRAAWQEWEYLKKGDRICIDRKTIIQDINVAFERNDLKHKFDCSMSSNMVEHCPNFILTLLNFYFITKKEGYQFHVIPHYKYTYDVYRKPHTLEHFIEDFRNNADENDRSHDEDYIQSAIVKHGWQREFHKEYPVAYPYMHYHVFDEHNTKEIFEFMFEGVTVDVIEEPGNTNNLVIFNNKLNPKFVSEFGALINEYSKNFL